MKQRFCTAIACLLGSVGVILGAIGAHGLEDSLATRETTAVWETAVDYQMWHAIVLLLIGRSASVSTGRWPVLLFSIGVFLFSGSLYWLALGGPNWLGPVTPLGGLSLIAGWLCLFATVWRGTEAE